MIERHSATLPDLIASARGSLLTRGVAFLALLALARYASPVLVPLAFAVVLALVLAAPYEWLRCRGVPSGVAAAACIGGVFGGGVIACLPVLGGLGGVRTPLAQVTGVESAWQLQLHQLAGHDGALGAVARMLSAQLGRLRGADIETYLWGATANGLLTLAAAGIIAFFVLLAQRSLWAATVVALPSRRGRLRCLGALREARRGIANYVAVMSLMNLALGASTGLALAALGLPAPGLWGVVTGLLAFIPYVGPAAITLLLVAAGGANFMAPWTVAAPALAFLLLHGLEANFISPWLLGRQLRISRVAIVIAVLLGTWALGLIGGALAVPGLLVARAVVRRTPGHALAKALLDPERGAAAPLAQTLRDALRSPAVHAARPQVHVAVHRIDEARTGALRPTHRAGLAIAPIAPSAPMAGAAPVAPVPLAAPVADPSEGMPFANVSPKRGRHD